MNQNFINWGTEKMKDRLFTKMLVAKAIYRFISYINSVDLEKKINEKLTKGGREHGEPVYTQNQVKKELEMEFLDLIGWQLISIWNQKLNQSKNEKK